MVLLIFRVYTYFEHMTWHGTYLIKPQSLYIRTWIRLKNTWNTVNLLCLVSTSTQDVKGNLRWKVTKQHCQVVIIYVLKFVMLLWFVIWNTTKEQMCIFHRRIDFLFFLLSLPKLQYLLIVFYLERRIHSREILLVFCLTSFGLHKGYFVLLRSFYGY